MTIKDDILERLNLRDLAEEAGAQFRGSGAWLISRCPLPGHAGDRNGYNFSIVRGADGREHWQCWSSCPADRNHGNAIDFWMAWKGVDFETALIDLKDRLGLGTDRPVGSHKPDRPVNKPIDPPPSIRPTYDPDPRWVERAASFVAYAQEQLWKPAGAAALHWLRHQRGLTDEVIQAACLGFNDADRWDDEQRYGDASGHKIYLSLGVVIPHFVRDRLSFVNVRRPLPGDALAHAIGRSVKIKPGEKANKYLSLRGGKRSLYGLDELTMHPVVILAEGEFDRLIAYQCANDFADVVTIGGAGMLLDTRGALALSAKPRIIVTYDADKAGDQGSLKLKQTLGKRIIVNPPPAEHDLTDYAINGWPLRGWLAQQVGAALDGYIQTLDEEQHAALLTMCLDELAYTQKVIAEQLHSDRRVERSEITDATM